MALGQAGGLTFVDLRETRDEQLLAEVYEGLYTVSFPREEEREPLSALRAGLWGDDGTAIGHFIVARREDGGAVEGFVACEYYPHSRCGLLSYVAVDEEARGHGVGRDLVRRGIEALVGDAAEQGAPLAAVFGEIHDPAKLPRRAT